jgi:hypothetical protein
MRTLKVAALAGSLLAVCGSAGAAEFAMMETAERIAQGSFKLSGFPVVVDRDRTAGNDAGFVVGLGYGLPYNLDLEGQVASYDDGTFLGADMEWNAWRRGPLAFSIGSGTHGADLEGNGYALGVDGTMIFSYNPMHRLALSAALDGSYDDVNNRDAGAAVADSRFPTDGQYETYHAVHGIGYLLTRNIDVLAEVGLGLNGESDDYVSAGMSWYFR